LVYHCWRVLYGKGDDFAEALLWKREIKVRL